MIKNSTTRLASLCGIVFLLGGVAYAGDSPQPIATDLDKTLTEFRAAADRLERAVGQTAKENTADLRQKLDKGASTVLSQMSKSLNQAAEKLEKHAKAAKSKAQENGT